MPAPKLTLLRRGDVARAIDALAPSLMDLIQATYVNFGEGRVVNPHSTFLLPPERPDSRIIALPAGVFDDQPAMGLKWISSFPANVAQGLDRASAVIVVNDPRTGYPLAVMEGALISAWRTALSAALAARLLAPRKTARVVGLIGCGVIARRTLDVLLRDGWRVDEVCLFDLAAERARAFALELEQEGRRCVVCETAEEAVGRGEVVVFATTAAKPWFSSPNALSHNPTVLHLSLRDLDPDLILAAENFTDDVEHATRAGTSLELASLKSGGATFIAGDMHALISGRAGRSPDRAAVFSPFGLGVLDIALASRVAAHAAQEGAGLIVEDFYTA
jgi:2,3-diaminopropionate biosynthesis protein SbnB